MTNTRTTPGLFNSGIGSKSNSPRQGGAAAGGGGLVGSGFAAATLQSLNNNISAGYLYQTTANSSKSKYSGNLPNLSASGVH